MSEKKLNVTIMNQELELITEETVFSPYGVDKGTLAMLSQVTFTPEDKVLDLGCGYGVVGILAAKLVGEENVVMSDVSDTAIELSTHNANSNGVGGVTIIKSNGFQVIQEKDFTKILSNPPYHEDFSVPKNFIEKGYQALKLGGSIYMVTKRLDWYKNKLTTVFGGVKVIEIDGYYVFIAEKRVKKHVEKPQKEQHLSKKLTRKYKK